MQTKFIIYIAEDLRDGRVYVGQTIRSLSARIGKHISESKQYFGRALRKYPDQFRFTVIDHADTQAQLNQLEQAWVFLHDCIYPKGYNMNIGGGSQSGWKASPEICEAVRLSKLGKKRPREFCERMRELALQRPPVSEATRAKMAARMRNRTVTAETRAKLALKKGQRHWLGRKHSEEGLANMRAAQAARYAAKPFPEGAKEKLRTANTGKVRTEASKLKQAISNSFKNHAERDKWLAANLDLWNRTIAMDSPKLYHQRTCKCNDIHCDTCRCVIWRRILRSQGRGAYVRKGRNPNQGSCKGEAHGMAVLKGEQILEMRRIYDSGVPFKEIGERFLVGKEYAWRICVRKIWRHLPEENPNWLAQKQERDKRNPKCPSNRKLAQGRLFI